MVLQPMNWIILAYNFATHFCIPTLHENVEYLKIKNWIEKDWIRRLFSPIQEDLDIQMFLFHIGGHTSQFLKKSVRSLKILPLLINTKTYSISVNNFLPWIVSQHLLQKSRTIVETICNFLGISAWKKRNCRKDYSWKYSMRLIVKSCTIWFWIINTF